MTFRPTAIFRQNIGGVILPLTGAIVRLYGFREQDGACPLGAFYTKNIDSRIWRRVYGVWYEPLNRDRIESRPVKEFQIQEFATSICTGAALELSSGGVVYWEPLPEELEQQLPQTISPLGTV
jgi:hypothetical protein